MDGRPTDRELLGLAAGGDGDAWVILWRRHRPALHALAMSFVFDAATAEDVVACAFERAHGALGRDFYGEHVGAWLRCITANCAIDELRRTVRYGCDLHLDIEAAPEDPDFRLAELVYERQSLARAVAMLTPAQQSLVHMKACELSTLEIAGRLGCSELAVRGRWARVLATLREIIGYHRDLAASARPAGPKPTNPKGDRR